MEEDEDGEMDMYDSEDDEEIKETDIMQKRRRVMDNN